MTVAWGLGWVYPHLTSGTFTHPSWDLVWISWTLWASVSPLTKGESLLWSWCGYQRKGNLVMWREVVFIRTPPGEGGAPSRKLGLVNPNPWETCTKSRCTVILALPLPGCVTLSKSLYLSGLISFCKIQRLVYICKVLSDSERKKKKKQCVYDSINTEEKLD